MDCCFLKRKGVALWEVMVVLFFMGVILSVLIPRSLERIKKAKYEKTIHELTSIAEAAITYFLVEGNWPSISQLAPQYITSVNAPNPFGESYQILSTNKGVIVFTLIPSGIAQHDHLGRLSQVIHQGNKDRIEVYQQMPHEFTSRLRYDLKYVY